ncbi:MAG: hypothetical protein R3E79_02765 [Caldilineaceae bacterium]
MLIAIVVVLVSPTNATLHAHLGRANYASTLERLNRVDPALGAAIHDGDGPKPITCSGLLNAEPTAAGVAIRAGERYFWRVTGLTAAVSGALIPALLDPPPTTWTLWAATPFRSSRPSVSSATHPWSGHTNLRDLSNNCSSPTRCRSLGDLALCCPHRLQISRDAHPPAFAHPALRQPGRTLEYL